MLRRFPLLKRISPKVYISICFFIYLVLPKVGVSLGYLFMDELQRAVAPFLHASGEGGAPYCRRRSTNKDSRLTGEERVLV